MLQPAVSRSALPREGRAEKRSVYRNERVKREIGRDGSSSIPAGSESMVSAALLAVQFYALPARRVRRQRAVNERPPARHVANVMRSHAPQNTREKNCPPCGRNREIASACIVLSIPPFNAPPHGPAVCHRRGRQRQAPQAA